MTLVKTPKQLEAMREGGRILAAILRELAAMARPGIPTRDISARAAELIRFNGVEPSFLGYNGYPDVICLSVNSQAVHTPGSDYVLKDGDLLKLDFGVVKGGFHTDTATTVLIADNPDAKEHSAKRKLMAVTKAALEAGIKECRAGNTLGHVSSAIGRTVKDGGFVVVRELGGHGIGRKLHEEPWIPNFGAPGDGPKLEVGMTVALEPITALSGKGEIKDGPDGFTYETKDGALSAHFEHTVVITEGEPEVLTR